MAGLVEMHEELGDKILITCGQGQSGSSKAECRRSAGWGPGQGRLIWLMSSAELQVTAHPSGSLVHTRCPTLLVVIAC